MNPRLLLTAVAVVAAGFGAFAADQKVELKSLPAGVQKAIRDETKGATLVGLSEEREDGKVLYEAETKVNGHTRDLLFDSTGALVEVEEEVAIDAVPAARRPPSRREGGQEAVGSATEVLGACPHEGVGSGGAEVFKELWKLLYKTLTEEYGLHNLIWEVNLYTYANSYEWYPGDEYVDIIGYDKYEGSPTNWGTSAATSLFLSLVNYSNDTKMVALTENDVIPDIQNIVNEGAWWLYFCPWYGEYLMNRNDTKLLNTIYNSKHVITLDELPKDLYDVGNTTPTPTPTKGVMGDLNADDSFDSIDFAILRAHLVGKRTLTSPTELANADVNGDKEINSLDFALMRQKLVGKISKFPTE